MNEVSIDGKLNLGISIPVAGNEETEIQPQVSLMRLSDNKLFDFVNNSWVSEKNENTKAFLILDEIENEVLRFKYNFDLKLYGSENEDIYLAHYSDESNIINAYEHFKSVNRNINKQKINIIRY